MSFFELFLFPKNTSHDSNTLDPFSPDEDYSENGQTLERDSPNSLEKVVPNTNVSHFNFKPKTSEQTSFGKTDDGNARQIGIKRFKIENSLLNGSLDNNNGIIITGSSHDGFEGSATDETMQVISKSDVKNDDSAIFCEFIASELRNLKTDQFRRKLKFMFYKCVVEVTEEEEALLAKRDGNLIDLS